MILRCSKLVYYYGSRENYCQKFLPVVAFECVSKAPRSSLGTNTLRKLRTVASVALDMLFHFQNLASFVDLNFVRDTFPLWLFLHLSCDQRTGSLCVLLRLR